MGDVATVLLDGKARLAESVFACVNDISARVKPKTEDKHPGLLAEIQAIMEPHSESESSLRTTLLYTNMTAKTVREALVQKG